MADTTADRDAAMFALYQTGATHREVGEAFGLGRSGVQWAFSQRGYPSRPRVARTPAELAEVRKARHAERRGWLNDIKTTRGCVDCGYNTHPAALQFDHLDGTTKIAGLSNNLARAWSWVEAEIAKCEVVCANCHAVRTATRGYRH